MAKRRTLQLSPEQRAELEATRDRDRRPYLREKAAALLKIADGMAPMPSPFMACFDVVIPTPSTAGSTIMRSPAP